MPMTVIVVGCGRIGSQLAQRLHEKGDRVVVVDRDANAFTRLSPDFRGRFVEGDVLSEDVLHRAGIEQADGLAAVTMSDAVNAVLGHVARSMYKIPNVVVRNFDPRWRRMIEAFDLQLVSSAAWGAQRFEELLDPRPMHSVFSAGNGEVDVYELVIPDACEGREVGDMSIPGECVVAALTRSGKATIPPPDTVMLAGDILHVSATDAGFRALRRRVGLE